MECFILWLYLHILYDIGKRDLLDVKKEDLMSPVFTFDMRDLLRIADFFRIAELFRVLCNNFLSEAVMFNVADDNLLHNQLVMGSVLQSVAQSESSEIVSRLATSYSKGTGGLRCLCMYPTEYDR